MAVASSCVSTFTKIKRAGIFFNSDSPKGRRTVEVNFAGAIRSGMPSGYRCTWIGNTAQPATVWNRARPNDVASLCQNSPVPVSDLQLRREITSLYQPATVK